jgi:hypothetical protein
MTALWKLLWHTDSMAALLRGSIAMRHVDFMTFTVLVDDENGSKSRRTYGCMTELKLYDNKAEPVHLYA